eukprot:1404830-Alexandrium_andersonii.AAC.1
MAARIMCLFHGCSSQVSVFVVRGMSQRTIPLGRAEDMRMRSSASRGSRGGAAATPAAAVPE